MADQLLVEILANIFLRLPIKTICHLACVCKSWNSLITSPTFIKAHHDRPQDPLLLFQGYFGKRMEFFTLHCENPAFDKYTEFTCPFTSSLSGFFRVIGCCSGVICLTDDQHTYIDHTFLWNPWIKKCIILPKPRVTFTSHGTFRQVLGFGFDEKNNEYKVVRIVYLDSSKNPTEVDVYRSSSGCWHQISHSCLQYKIGRKAPQVYLNGATHWLAYNKSKNHHMVVAFQMADEVFCYIKPPNRMEFSKKNLLVPPGDCKGYLTLTSREGSGYDETWSVWVMKEYGVAKSWIKQLWINGNPEFERLLGETTERELISVSIWQSGELISYHPKSIAYKLQFERLLGFGESGDVFFATKSGDTISYHPRSGFRKVELCGIKRPYRPLFASSYRESIGLLGTKGHVARDRDGAESENNDQEKEETIK